MATETVVFNRKNVLTLAERWQYKQHVLGQDICAIVILSPDVGDCRRRETYFCRLSVKTWRQTPKRKIDSKDL